MKQSEFNKQFIEAISSGLGFEEILPLMKNFSQLSAHRALEVYREDYLVRLSEALKNTYKTVSAVLGDEDFFQLATEYLARYPSSFSDLDDFGHRLEEFLTTHPLSQDYPFLPQLARFEWMFRLVFHAKEVQGLSALELERSFQEDSWLLTLVPSAFVLSFDYAVEKIFSSIEEDKEFSFDFPQYILIFKKKAFVKMHFLTKNQYDVVKNFHSPLSLSSCIKKAPATMTPEEMQSLFTILASEQILLKS